MLCGGSSGAVVAGLEQLTSLRPDLVDEGKTVVIVLPDGLRNYLTKFADDDSMAQHVRD